MWGSQSWLPPAFSRRALPLRLRSYDCAREVTPEGKVTRNTFSRIADRDPREKESVMACPGQADGTLNATGTGVGSDFKTAEGKAQTAMDMDLLNAKLAWEKANACPQGCGFMDVWTD